MFEAVASIAFSRTKAGISIGSTQATSPGRPRLSSWIVSRRCPRELRFSTTGAIRTMKSTASRNGPPCRRSKACAIPTGRLTICAQATTSRRRVDSKRRHTPSRNGDTMSRARFRRRRWKCSNRCPTAILVRMPATIARDCVPNHGWYNSTALAHERLAFGFPLARVRQLRRLQRPATNQGAARLTSYTGKSYSAFHQGYLIQQDGNTRGRYLQIAQDAPEPAC